MGATEDRLWQVVEPYVAAEGIELDDLLVLGQGPQKIVRVTVDGDDPVGVDHIARMSRGIERLLDEADPFPGAYTLEVSSPGLERALRRPRHYEKSIDCTVMVKTHGPVDEERNHSGILREARERDFTVEVNGMPRVIAYDQVASARTVFEWETGATPGKGRHSRNRGTA